MAKEKITIDDLSANAAGSFSKPPKVIGIPETLQVFDFYRKLLRGDTTFIWNFYSLELRRCFPSPGGFTR